MGYVESNKSFENAAIHSQPDTASSCLNELQTLARRLAGALAPLPVEGRLLHMRREVSGSIVFTTSFGIEDQLILHLLREHQIDVNIVTMDTGRLFAETHDVWAESERRYGVRIRVVYPQQAALEALVAAQGTNGFYDSPKARVACCQVRKVEPLNRALAGAAAWVTGIRSDQSNSRRAVEPVSVDLDRGILKFNPLFDWTRDAVLSFTRSRNVPVNSLHARGFASIGCAPCTRPIRPDEPERAGRWWWEEGGTKECGLHERHRSSGAPDRVEATS
jgi:phosphoadenosine phosphosulfate reductase